MEESDLAKYVRIVQVLTEKESRLNDFDFFALSRARDFVEATDLGLKYFRYGGPIYDLTGEFCSARIGKIFSVDQLFSWRRSLNRPNTPEYDPALHLGGDKCLEGEVHCNHRLWFLSAAHLARERPDLKIPIPTPIPSWEDLVLGLDRSGNEVVRDFAKTLQEGRSGLMAKMLDMAGRKFIAAVLSEEGMKQDGRRTTLEEATRKFLTGLRPSE